jgi:hypothetical protein
MNSLFEKFKNFSPSKIDKAYLDACDNGNLDEVKYLITSDDLKITADVHCENDRGLRLVCSRGHLNLIKYFLSSDDCKHSFSINTIGSQPLISAFNSACNSGQLNIIKYFLTLNDIKDSDKFTINEGFCIACRNGYLEVVQYLLNFHKPKMEKFAWSSSMYSEYYYFNALNQACYCSKMDIVQYLINSIDNKQINISKISENLLNTACVKGDLEMIQYLIKSPNINNYYKLNITQSHLELAYGNNNLDLTKMLLMHKDYNQNIDIHANDDSAFTTAIINTNFDLLNVLIFDYGIKLTTKIKSLLEEYDTDGQIKKLFDMREINKELNDEISTNQELKNNKLKL